MNEKDELYRQIARLEQQFEKNKFRRMIITIAGIAIAFFIMFFIFGEINGIEDLLSGIITSIVGAGIYFYVSALIFIPLFNKSQEENKYLEELKKKYDELNK